MSDVLELEDIDVFADVLDSVRIRGRVFCRAQFSAPWTIGFASGAIAHFHIIEAGRCYLVFGNGTDPVSLAANDVVLVAPGRNYQLSDDLTAPTVALSDLVGSSQGSAHKLLKFGGGGSETELICGAFECRSDYAKSLWSTLPMVIRVNSRGKEGNEWLDATVKLLRAETRQRDEGTAAVIGRLTEIVFAQAVRTWLHGQPDGAAGWLGALRDSAVGTALKLMHQAPDRAWTVSKLASEVAMSRSPFAARFVALVGVTPMAYLARWRMQMAAEYLTSSTIGLKDIAKRVGYASVAAFSRAFKDQYGRSPATFRRWATATQRPRSNSEH